MNARTAVAAACALCAACSLFVDTGEFTAENGVVDAGQESSSVPPDITDAGSDVPSIPVDAAEAGPVPCPDGGFCDSFERTAAVGPWDGLADDGQGCAVGIDGTVANEGKTSLALSLADKATDSCQVYITRNFGSATPKKITLAFDLRVPALVDREVQIAGFHLNDPERSLFFMLILGGIRIAEQQFGTNGSFNSYLVGGVEPNQWHHVELVHDIATKATTVKYDGTVRVDRPTNVSFEGTGFTLGLGTNFTRAGGPGTVWFDDYRFLAE